MKKFSFLAGIFSACTLSFASTAPVQAAACPVSSTQLGSLTPLAFTCTQGNFTFKLNSFTGFLNTDSISFSNSGDTSFTYSLNSDTPWLAGTVRNLNYSITAPTGKVLSAYTAALSSSQANPKSGEFDVDGSAGTAMSNLIDGVSTNDQHDYMPPTLATDTFTGELRVPVLNQVNGNGIQTVQSTVFVTSPTASVPGPLPIFGAAVAFGFSRKVRNRIKAFA